MTISENRNEIREYLIAAGYVADDVISVVWKARSGALGWTHVRAEEADKVIDGHRLVDTWISAAVVRKPSDPDSRGTADDVVAVRALWADLDVGPGKMASYQACRAVVDEVSEILGVRPTVLLASGHGLQPRWRFAHGDVTDLAQLVEGFGRLVRQIAETHGGKADNVYDLARIIRAPGTTNCKDSKTGIPVKVKFALGERGTVMAVELRRILTERGLYEGPVPPAPTPVETPNVDRSRGNRYVRSILVELKKELADIRDWPLGKTDERGRGWEKIQADAAYRLAELAKAEWNDLTEERAKILLTEMAPVDTSWTIRDVLKKWASQVKRAEPAKPPLDVTDDPLSGGYIGSPRQAGTDASPHPVAPTGAAPKPAGGDRSDGEGHRSAGEPDVPLISGVDHGDGAADDGGAAGGEGGHGTGDSEATPAVDDVTWRMYTWDDFGNAERTVALYGNRLRWSPSLDRWFAYRDGAWRESKVGGERAVQAMIRQVPELEAGLYSDEEYRKGKTVTSQRGEFLEFIGACRTASRVTAAAKVLRNDGELDISPVAFDSDPMLLNAVNGVVDLNTGDLLEHNAELMLRRQVPVTYDPDAKAPMWEAYLERVQPSEEERAYLQRITGYSITGKTTEQAMFIHHGVTHNGKGVFLRVMEALLGEFSRIVPPTTLLAKKLEQHPTDVMGLEGRRMLQVDEVPEGARLDEALIKRLTGQSTLTARGMGQDFQDFRITGKIHMVVNHMPHMGDDAATKRRIHVVKWNVTIPIEERDDTLADRIIANELDGVLAWCVRGALEWGQRGLDRTLEAFAAAEEYFASEDEFGQWIEDELIIGAEAFVSTKDLYRRYRQWSESIGVKPMSSIAFGRKLSARGVEAARTKETRGWKVALRSAFVAPDPLGD